jgi:hypothetical protein
MATTMTLVKTTMPLKIVATVVTLPTCKTKPILKLPPWHNMISDDPGYTYTARLHEDVVDRRDDKLPSN